MSEKLRSLTVILATAILVVSLFGVGAITPARADTPLLHVIGSASCSSDCGTAGSGSLTYSALFTSATTRGTGAFGTAEFSGSLGIAGQVHGVLSVTSLEFVRFPTTFCPSGTELFAPGGSVTEGSFVGQEVTIIVCPASSFVSGVQSDVPAEITIGTAYSGVGTATVVSQGILG